MNISIYLLCYNEELMLPFTVNWYRTRFPNSTITVLDNHSTDRTYEIARDLGCHIYQFNTDGKISDKMYQYLKNNHWKKATTDWILCADVDELIDITEAQLRDEENDNTTIIKGEAFNMVNLNDDLNVAGMDHGYRDNMVHQLYDKSLIFNKKYISEINYKIGAHGCLPEGLSNWNKRRYILRHYKFINPDLMVARYKCYAERLSDENKLNSWGGQYNETENTIRVQFEQYRKIARKVL